MLALTATPAGLARPVARRPAGRLGVRPVPRPVAHPSRAATAVTAAAPSSSSAEADLMAPAPIPVKGEKVRESM